MRLSYVWEGEQKELGRQQAPGACPFCGGKVVAMDVEFFFYTSFSPYLSFHRFLLKHG
ncbi:hypothetical protein RYX36_027648 [Vicia faba]